MSDVALGSRAGSVVEELRKLPAFFRRDLLVMWSYRLAFFTDWLNLLVQIVVFFFVSRLIDPAKIPSFGGERASYMQFVAIGIAVTSFMQISLGRVVSAIRTEQLQGTLEALLITPTAPTTIQLGSVLYELFYVPIRLFIFLGLSWVLFGVTFEVSGMLPAIGVLIVFVPFVWGIGVLSAAGVLTFRRGTGAVGVGATAFTISSGTYFPVGVLPAWLQPLAKINPITIALVAIRRALLGGAGWAEVTPTIVLLLPIALVSIAIGVVAFRAALRRERRRGTLGLY